MNSHNEILSFMDLLDLDEEVIDSRLRCIMKRSTFSNKQLLTAIHLLQYKQLINVQEGIDCENNEELEFVGKLINNLNKENIDDICKITNIVLNLNTSTIIRNSEHLLQQIISDINLLEEQVRDTSNDDTEDDRYTKSLLTLKLCDSILDVVIKNGEKMYMPFLDTPLETVLSSPNENLKLYFLVNTVPKLFDGIVGYNILDRIWNHLKQSENAHYSALKILCCLSEFYLPIPDNKGNFKVQSEIVFQHEFWDILLFGLQSNDCSVRKMTVYLLKRSIDCLMALKKNVLVKMGCVQIFTWDHKKEKTLKQMWDNFFILIDSLEEKQSNIVLPSLQLFESLDDIESCWINCAFNIGLKHDNTQVRLKCIEYKLYTKINSGPEAVILLEALNDINIYDHYLECGKIKNKLSGSIKDIHTFVHVFEAISSVKWSPVPLYHLSNVLAGVNLEGLLCALKPMQISQAIIEILKVSCNNVTIRRAIQVNILDFVRNCCRGLPWKEYINIFAAVNFEIFSTDSICNVKFIVLTKESFQIGEDDKVPFFKCIADSYKNADFVLLYLEDNPDDLTVLIKIVAEKIRKIQDIVRRQYSEKMDCFADVLFLTNMFCKTAKKDQKYKEIINATVATDYKTILQYVLYLLSIETVLCIDEIESILKNLSFISAGGNNDDFKDIVLQLYKSAVLVINDKNSNLDKRVLSIFLLQNLLNNIVLTSQYKHEMVNLKQFLKLIDSIDFKEVQNMESSGRLRNIFYEKSCEIAYCLLKEQNSNIQKNLKSLIDFIDNVVECGGYGCLKWILKIINEILSEILLIEDIHFDITQFINRVWKEIEELKSNNQYSLCIEEFVNLITQDSLLKMAVYDSTIIHYFNKIIEYGPVKNTPLFYLAKKLNKKHFTSNFGQLIYGLSEILLYSPVPRKDHRIAENVAVEILHDLKYDLRQNDIDIHFNFQIQYLAISTLSKIEHPDIIDTIALFILNKVDETFKNKQRYHGNSQPHRTLLTALQHLLLMKLLNLRSFNSESIMSWSLELLGKLPHQPSVRICLEWYIALCFYVNNQNLNEVMLQGLRSKNIPLMSQFMILYWILKRKISNNTYKKEEYEFVMNTLLSHTMGQMFNIRLHAQYLATKLFQMNQTNSETYVYTIKIIKKTFMESSKDKQFIKLEKDFFIHSFDIFNNLTPGFIYYFVPMYCEINRNEKVDKAYIKNILKDVNENIKRNDGDFSNEWKQTCNSNDEAFKYDFNISENNTIPENLEPMFTIQKKYIPWKNMSEVDVYEISKKKKSFSELIVVASLIDKLPNLGGMARTSEVFGVQTYVVDSLRHLQDKQFQGLSVSAERWVNVEEVRPGPPLKDYLMMKKAEGYSVVAAEQTSTSCQLQFFKFPKKTLLLLGHEKEGIPCDLLPIMDHCVEIPQQGFVRSLNVHVTAAIFIWEYARQNII